MRVHGDRQALRTLFDNLLANARKYTPAGGTVKVLFAHGGEGIVRIVVEDTGIGIPESEQERLFRPFFRASNAKKATTNGTGLGLALVKQTVERHGGRLEVTSREGEGTTVMLALPARRPAV